VHIQGTPIAVIGSGASGEHRLVREDEPFPVSLFDGLGNPISSLSGAINTHDVHVHRVIVNKYFALHTGIATTLAVALVGGQTEWQISVADATGFSVGDFIHLGVDPEEPTHFEVTAISAATGPSVFTFDRRIDGAWPIGCVVDQAVVNMVSLDGTMASPLVYWVAPEAGQVWHIQRILLELTHDSAGDLGNFGGIDALGNGFVIRGLRDGEYRTFSNWKRGSDFKTDMFDVEFDSRSGGQGEFGTSGRGTFLKTGSVVRLDGDTGDRLEIVCQDTVAGLGINSFTVKAQGHPENA